MKDLSVIIPGKNEEFFNQTIDNVLANKRAGTLSVTQGANAGATTPTFLGEEVSETAAVVSGLTFTFNPNPSLTSNVQTTITVYGNETGGSVTIPVTVTYRA
jgi:hypothetical protein